MKLLFKSIGAGIFISLILFMAFAIIVAILMFINNLGGIEYIVGFIFLIAVTMFSFMYYYQNK